MFLLRRSARGRAYRSATYHVAWLLPLVSVLAVVFSYPGILNHVRDQLFDSYQRRSPLPWDSGAPIRIVDIDDESIARLGQWPWPRTLLSALIERLRAAKAAAVGFDILFSEADRTSPELIIKSLPEGSRREQVQALLAGVRSNDEILAATLTTIPAILGLVLTQDVSPTAFPAPYGFATMGRDPRAIIPQFAGAVVPLSILAGKAAGLGFLNWMPDTDEIVRRVPLLLDVGDRRVPSLAMEMLRVAQGASTFTVRTSDANGGTAFGGRTVVDAVRIGEVQAATEADGALRIHYSRHETGRFFPAWKILSGEIGEDQIDGRLILVGSSAVGLNDVRATPIEAAVPGVEIQAQVLETLLARTQLLRPEWAATLEFAAAIVLAMSLAMALPVIPVVAGGALVAFAIGGVTCASWVEFKTSQVLLDPIPIVATLGAVYLCCTATLFRTEQKGRRFVQDAFGRFVSPDVVARLANNPERLVLGGEERTITVMFTDVRNFSRIAERLSPADLTRFMNRYLSPMSEIVLNAGGTVDKYIGDAIMAFWNAPLTDAAHARHAASAALKMIHYLPALNAAVAESFGDGFPTVRCGIGLASGPCVVGNLGSRQRFDYSALGDDVNLASRLESATKFYGLDILASEVTRALTPDLAWIEVDVVEVAGKSNASRVFTLLGDEAYARTPAFASLFQDHSLMLSQYRGRCFDSAAKTAVALQKMAPGSLTGVYAIYAAWSAAHREMPPAEEWDAVTRLSLK